VDGNFLTRGLKARDVVAIHRQRRATAWRLTTGGAATGNPSPMTTLFQPSSASAMRAALLDNVDG
jgi:hypothetical protein